MVKIDLLLDFSGTDIHFSFTEWMYGVSLQYIFYTVNMNDTYYHLKVILQKVVIFAMIILTVKSLNFAPIDMKYTL